MTNQVIAKFLDGIMLRGGTVDVGNKDIFHITTSYGITKEVHLQELKAVFFLKGPTGANPASATDVHVGPKVRVRFQDQEELAGVSFDYRPGRDRFFLFPLDPASNNERILVNARATVMVTRLGADYRDDQAAPTRDGLRRRLESEVAGRLRTYARQFAAAQNELVDDHHVASYGKSLKSKMDAEMTAYINEFGRDAWRKLLSAQIGEIRNDLGESAYRSMQRIASRLT